VKGKEGYLTYLLEGKSVVTAHWDHTTKEMVKETILNLSLQTSAEGVTDVATDLFVFDDMVAVRVNDLEVKFFAYPMIVMNYVEEIPFNLEQNKNLPGPPFDKWDEIRAYGMQYTNNTGDISYELYALLNNTVVKVQYIYSHAYEVMYQGAVNRTINTTDIDFDGELMRGVTSRSNFIVSCADCRNASV